MAGRRVSRLEGLDYLNNGSSIPLRVYYRKMARKLEHNFPEELIIEILKCLPVKSLLRFMCVSRSWYSIITSPSFVPTHLSYQSSPTTKDPISTLYGVACQFFMHRLHEPLEQWAQIDSPIDNLGVVVGYCHGVVCLFDYCSEASGPLVLWNPSIRKALTLPLPVFSDQGSNIANNLWPNSTFGFGLDPVTCEYKVVRIVYNWREESNATYLHTHVCSLSKGSWRTFFTVVEDDRFILECKGIYVNGVIHWMCKRKRENAVICETVLTFNLSDENFGEIPLPTRVDPLSIAVLMTVKMVEDKLAVSCKDSGGNVWVMEDYGNLESWRRVFNVHLGDNLGLIQGALFIEDGRTVVITSAGNWISWDCRNDKIENLTLPTLEPTYVNAYVPSLVLLGCKYGPLRCKKVQLKKKTSKIMTGREYRSLMHFSLLRQGGYIS